MMNVLAKAEVFAENKLFATLDTTVRKVVVGNLPFLMSDTVGFIRKLPHQLVESFKSTLDETREADVLVHVLDISHPGFEDQYRTVQDTLTVQGWSYERTVIVTSITPVLARIQVEMARVDSLGPSHAVTSYTSAVW